MAIEVLPPRGRARALFSAVRPRQWLKNCLVAVGPGAAGTLLHGPILTHTIVAFAAFCCVASSLYLVNDVRDADSDRRHPQKRFRAIASGQLSPRAALASSVVLLAVGFAIPAALPHPAGFYFILALYVASTTLYTMWLKTVAVIELGAVASGFFLRAYGGAVASHIPVSSWFLAVVTFGALFLVTGKRSAELQHVGTETRDVLDQYTPQFLHSALTMSATVTVTAYCLWAFNGSKTGLSAFDETLTIRLTIVPVVLAVLVVMRAAESPEGQAPEELLLRNRTVQALGLIWLILLGIGIYG